MNFELSKQQMMMKNEAARFAQKELNENLNEREKEGVFPMALWKKCAEFGILGSVFPEQYGGNNTDILSAVLMMEGLGYGCRDNGLIFALNSQMWTVQMPIFRFGSEEQKNKYLPRLCRGDLIGAHGMTEPDAGSDAYSLKTHAVRDGDFYMLNGSKTFTSLAPVANLFLIFATVDESKGFMGVTAFLVERDFKGFKVGHDIDKMGLKSAPMAELFMDKCYVPVKNRLGREGNGAAIFDDDAEWERSCILAGIIGGMERQLERSIKYAKTRRQFNQPIGKFQSVANKIVDMKIRLETARLILYRLAWMKEKHGKATMDAAIAKLYLSESYVKSCLDAIQIHGGYGYTTEYGLERDLRDSVASTLYSGTSEIQRNIIAKFLGL